MVNENESIYLPRLTLGTWVDVALGTRFSGDLAVVGHSDLRGHLQPQQFYDSPVNICVADVSKYIRTVPRHLTCRAITSLQGCDSQL